MPAVSQSTIDSLNSIPLDKVMRANGYAVVRKTRNYLFYRCPFHKETDASFKVDRNPLFRQNAGEIPLAGFYCYGCGEKGYGALMLQARLMDTSLKEEFRKVVDRLARIGNIPIEGDNKNGWFHRSKEHQEASDEIKYTFKDTFSLADLRSLGCEVSQVFFSSPKNLEGEKVQEALTDENGNAVYKYSFGSGYYSNSCRGNNFDPIMLINRFNLYPVRSFITEKRWSDKKNAFVSYEVESTDTYPIFAFIYKDKKGWWSKKYEPLFKPTENKDGTQGANYKFTWWYEGGKIRDNEMSRYLYGDTETMEAIYGEGVKRNPDADHPTVDVCIRRGEDRQTISKFKELVICSGPRDAISVYFHSTAHVVFPHSESTEISDDMIFRLREIADKVYILYDADKTGIRATHRLALRHLELRVLYLPKELKDIRSFRTGKPCKDAEEYFTHFPSRLKDIEHFHGKNINDHFRAMLTSAKPMMFWQRKGTSHKDEYGDRYMTYKYTLDIDCMAQFLAAQGFYKYRANGTSKFVYLENNIVNIIEDNDILTKAKQLMKEYLKQNPYYYDKDLANAISETRRLSRDTLNEIPEVDLNFHSWGDDFDYFFYRNGAVMVTPDEISLKPYSQVPYHVNKDAILEDEFVQEKAPLFEIVPNPDYVHRKKEHEERMHGMDGDRRKVEQAEFRAWERLWKYKLVLHRDMKDMPPVFQFLYDTGRVYWKKEESGMALSPTEKQFQDMQFINKAGAIGYILSRFRTDLRQQMVTITDYSVIDEGKSCGRNGKSTMMNLLKNVRKGIEIQGKSFKTNAESIGKNFSDFRQTIHSYASIDDFRLDFKSELLFNLVRRITVKTLYNDEILLPEDESPKIIATMNKPFDLTDPSTFGRIYATLVCDYYHEESYSGDVQKRSPETKFGKDIVRDATPEEHQFLLNMMAQFLQFYLKTKAIIVPPVEKAGVMRVLYQSISDHTFIEWGNKFFTNNFHFEHPCSLREMVISYLDFIGEDVTNLNIKKRIPQFKKDISVYCENMRIRINPSVVYRGEDDRKAGVVRCNAWATRFNGERPFEPRVRELSLERCMYFYRWGNEPREYDHVLKAPETDPDIVTEPEDEE